MTAIDFYTGVPDKLAFACQLAAKVVARGSRLVICAPDAATEQHLDGLLWTWSQLSFLPHCHATHRLATETPVNLCHEAHEFSHYETLLNLQADCPPFFSRFDRLLEIVTTEESDRAAGRERYRFYRNRGYLLRDHPMGR